MRCAPQAVLLWLLSAAPALATQVARAGRKFEFAIVGIPLSPLHSVVVIGQELCLRGHNVTVLSFDEKGRKKTEKYSPVCKLNYVSLGPMPVDEGDAFVDLSKLTNDTFKFVEAANGALFQPLFMALKAPLAEVMAKGIIRPDYALVSMPFGDVGQIMQSHGVDFAVNLPTILAPPLVPYAAPYVPLAFHHVGLFDMGFWDRLLAIGSGYLVHFLKHLAAYAGFRFSFMSDMNPELWWGRLVLVNSIPGFDYPQALPPLVQYTGPVMDLSKMEPFPPEVEAFLNETEEGVPVVYVSFGTVFVLSPERVAAMVNTMTSERYRVLWALPKAQRAGLPAELPANIMVHHWIPTPRTLAHPKVAAFVSHCGGNSATEAMAWGVPIVGYPQIGDQPAVCQRIADAGAGRSRPAGSWVQAEDILEVIGTPSYARRAGMLSRLFPSFGGVEKAANLLELGASGDLDHLRLPTEHSWRRWFQLGGYEALALALALSHLGAVLALPCCRGCCRALRRLPRALAKRKQQ